MRFLSTLPAGLERVDLRVIHAAWQDEQIAVARALPLGSLRHHYDKWELAVKREAAKTDLEQHMVL